MKSKTPTRRASPKPTKLTQASSKKTASARSVGEPSGPRILALGTRSPANWDFSERLRLARLLHDKCELAESRASFESILVDGREAADVEVVIECLIGLLRLSAEALDGERIRLIESQLDQLEKSAATKLPPLHWLAKGMVAARQGEPRRAIRHYLRYSRQCRRSTRAGHRYSPYTREEGAVRAWIHIVAALKDLGNTGRAEAIAQSLVRNWVPKRLPMVNAHIFHVMGRIEEGKRRYAEALEWYRKAYSAALAEHNWQVFLYILLSHAVIARKQRNYPLAYQYLELVENALTGPEFGVLIAEVAREKQRLERDAIDLLIDSRKGVIQTREVEAVSLRKQHILLQILEALMKAHQDSGEVGDGLSKAEIIRQVWGEDYRPEAHDNKLYYNINRLRKLIEPDMRKPKYLLNWREGYRLAPGLRVQHVSRLEAAKGASSSLGSVALHDEQ